jgi:ribosomal protein S2
MLAFCRDLDVQYKTAFVLAHKLREAMASATKVRIPTIAAIDSDRNQPPVPIHSSR